MFECFLISTFFHRRWYWILQLMLAHEALEVVTCVVAEVRLQLFDKNSDWVDVDNYGTARGHGCHYSSRCFGIHYRTQQPAFSGKNWDATHLLPSSNSLVFCTVELLTYIMKETHQCGWMTDHLAIRIISHFIRTIILCILMFWFWNSCSILYSLYQQYSSFLFKFVLWYMYNDCF